MNKKLLFSLSLAIFFQFLILIGMYVSAALPLWTGQEIRLKTIPVDPRSLFRGNYAQLQYKISQIETKHFPDSKNLRNGEVVYIILKPGKNELYEFARVSLDRPQEGIFLRARIENRWYEEKADYFRLKFGIEAFFAPKDKALELENKLRENGIAVLMVSSSGKARIKGIIEN